MVSILIAARNEEKNIIACLEAIHQQQWPEDQLEVLVGDDHSEDRTATLVREYIRNKPHFHLISITRNFGQARGKANVLAHLAQRASGKYFLITDADVQVPATWVGTMVTACHSRIGVVNGVTVVQGTTLLHRLQALEWVYSIGLMRWFAEHKAPITAMGNNMLITREAYQATGGYENLPFSITEDYQLFREVLKKGYGFRQLFEPGVLAFTQPAGSLSHLLQQRKRWMTGAMQLPVGLRVLLILGALFLPALLLLAFFFPGWAVSLFLLQTFGILYSLRQSLRQLKLVHFNSLSWLYSLYHYVILVVNLVYYFLPGKIRWKSREYGKG